MFLLLEAFDAADLRVARALVEAHGPEGLLVGVNSRDLATLQVRPERLRELAGELPGSVPCVAESGLASAEDAREVAAAGYRVGAGRHRADGARGPARPGARDDRRGEAGMNGTWIKICGITTAEAVSAADSVDVDAIGFVFAESPRRVTPERAFRLAAPIRGRIACCAVVRRTSQAEVDEILRVLRPDMLQVDVGELDALTLPRTLQVLPVASTRSKAPDDLPGRMLLERPPTDDGTGWDEDGIRGLSRRTRLVLAGGLDADNVGPPRTFAHAVWRRRLARRRDRARHQGTRPDPPLRPGGAHDARGRSRYECAARTSQRGAARGHRSPGRFPDARGRYGPFGGRYVPETLVAPLERLGGSVRVPAATRSFSTRYRARTAVLGRTAHGPHRRRAGSARAGVRRSGSSAKTSRTPARTRSTMRSARCCWRNASAPGA